MILCQIFLQAIPLACLIVAAAPVEFVFSQSEDEDSRQRMTTIEHSSNVNGCCLSHDGKILAVAGETAPVYVTLYDATNGTKISEYQLSSVESTIKRMAFSPSGSELVVVGLSGRASIFELSGDNRKIVGHSILKLEFSLVMGGSSAKPLLAWINHFGKVTLFDYEEKSKLSEFKMELFSLTQKTKIHVSERGGHLLVAMKDAVQLLDTKAKTSLQRVKICQSRSARAFNYDGTKIVSINNGKEERLEMLETRTGKTQVSKFKKCKHVVFAGHTDNILAANDNVINLLSGDDFKSKLTIELDDEVLNTRQKIGMTVRNRKGTIDQIGTSRNGERAYFLKRRGSTVVLVDIRP